MKSIPFPEVTNKIGEEQEEFETINVQCNEDDRSVNICFKLTKKEVAEIVKTKKIWYKQFAPNGKLHQMKLSPFKHEIITLSAKVIDDKN